EEYRELGAEHVYRRLEENRKAYLTKELKKIGYQVELKQVPVPAS
ncbi:MAG: hypothetical protein GX963_05975, partial [Bacteroidales bacterium]|nr:hypothetical protein [Bacteroidales bacterium]NMA73704.1 hypothetical protein [Bacteroidales bacterium]